MPGSPGVASDSTIASGRNTSHAGPASGDVREAAQVDFGPDWQALSLTAPGPGDIDRNDIGVTDETRHEGRRRPAIDQLRAIDLLDPAAIEDRHPIGQRQSLALIVGDIEEGGAHLAMHPAEFLLHVEADGEIQGRQRLVQQQDLRPGDQNPGQGHALHLAAGELMAGTALVTREAAPGPGHRRRAA